MSLFRVFLKPFNDDGTYQDDYIEVTEDVKRESVGDIRQAIDDDEYEVGVLKFADFSFELRNENGRYSDVGTEQTIFRYSRAGSKVKVIWQEQNFEPYAGVAYCGGTIAGNEEIETFEGLLNDESADSDVMNQGAKFRVLSKESVFSNTETPFSDIANGDTVKELIVAALSQTLITDLLTVDALNINPGYNAVIDDVSGYENSTVKELLDDLLRSSSSVLYVKNDTVYVSARVIGATLAYEFFGQASNRGLENIINLNGIRSGLNKTFNYWTWPETDLLRKDDTSVARYGVRKKEVQVDAITTTGTREDILEALLDQFKDPKQEFTLTTPINPDTLALNILDKVKVDYPTVLFPASGHDIPIYDVSIYDEDFYPFEEWTFVVPYEDNYKIMSKNIKTKDQVLEFILKKE